MNVGMLNLQAQFKTVRDEVLKEVTDIFETQYFVLGPRVKKLEADMAALAGVPYGIGVSSGTDALLLSVMALEPNPETEIITTPFTFFATGSSIVRGGARIVFADVEEDTFNIDIRQAESAITSRTRAIIPVHLFGHMVEPESWIDLCKKKNLVLIEDAAQAVASKYNGFTAGGMGDIACFSFYPTKNLGGAGDGGMVLTKDAKFENHIRANRVHGGHDRYYHDRIGICGRLDEIQAAVLLIKLKHLNAWNERRRKIAGMFNEAFKKLPVHTPVEREGAFHTYHQYVMRVPKRDQLREHLKQKGVGTEIYYPLPLHMQECFKYLGYKDGQFPISEKLSREAIALPMNSELTDSEVNHVIESVSSFYGS